MFRIFNKSNIFIYFLFGILSFHVLFMFWRVSIPYVLESGISSESLQSEKILSHDYEDTNHIRFDVGKVKLNFLPNFKSPCFLEKLSDEPATSGENTIYSKSAYLRQTYTKYTRFGAKIKKYMASKPQGVLINDTYGTCGIQGKCRVRCLPYFMLLGLAKSGTSDFFSRMRSHPHVLPGTNKELFYWTQYRIQINATLGDYSILFDNSLESVINKPQIDDTTGEDYYPYVFGDFTSVTFTDEVWWREHPGNKGLIEPKYLKIHDIYKAIPNVKLIVILRNPTSRLYSSYNMFRRGMQPSPEDFHARVVKSIEWWQNCTVLKGLPRRTCAYGSPPEMPPVVCVLADRGQNNRWYGPPNVANYSGEIRRGMYSIFLKDWYSVFPKNQLLLIKTEEYSKNPLSYFNNVVLPFLDIQQVTNKKIFAKKDHSNSRTYQPILPETKQILDKFYEPFNKELANYIGDDKWLWKDA